jgi:hypothetical protein
MNCTLACDHSPESERAAGTPDRSPFAVCIYYVRSVRTIRVNGPSMALRSLRSVGTRFQQGKERSKGFAAIGTPDCGNV